jgi:catechol 2,3-dioxygenase-like lactoylglutathione lyase family enzyme
VGEERHRIIGMHHVGIPVRSLEQAVAWYRDVLGIEAELLDVAEGPELSRTVQLAGARLRSAFVSMGNTIVELLEYEHPVGADFSLRNCDVGATHVCIEVEDIHAAYERMRDRGVGFSSPPVRLSGALEGSLCCYFRGHDRLQFELWQRPRRRGEDSSAVQPTAKADKETA